MRKRSLVSRPWVGVCLALLWNGIVAAPASADQVNGTRSEELKERSHEIQLTLAPDHAKLVVRRTVYNGGPRHDQAVFFIDLPAGAVATGLRTLGTLGGRPHWFDGELLEAEAAAARYRELTGIGAYYPKDPALLSWRSQDLLALQVFPCAPKQPKSIEYTLVVPTQYRDGKHHLQLPALGTEELVASVTAQSRERGYRLAVGGGAPPSVMRPERGAPLDFTLTPLDAPKLGGDFVTSEFAPGRVLVRYAARAAPRLSEVPSRAHIVVAIDTSLSTDSEFVARAKRALDAYLAHFEADPHRAGRDARVELVLYDRKVQRVFGAFLPVHTARARLAALEIRRKNGSEIDRALYEADRLLGSAPVGSARRIVLVTDGHARQGLTAERLRAATAGNGAVTHVGVLSEGSPSLTRDDEHVWARGLEPNDGIVWHANASLTESAAELRDVYEEWARPVRLHQFHAYSPEPEWSETLTQIEPVLDEGEGIEALWLAEQRSPWLTFEGKLWTKTISEQVLADPKKEPLWAALTFGSPLLHDLTEEEMMTLALKGRAVSPVTSYLAIEPGVRPSTEGLEHESQGFGTGFGGGLRGAHTTVTGRGPVLDREEFLRQRLATDWRRCGGRPGEASVTLETTLAEIVHVEPVATKARDPLLARCLTEATWDLILPASFDEPWNTWTIDV